MITSIQLIPYPRKLMIGEQGGEYSSGSFTLCKPNLSCVWLISLPEVFQKFIVFKLIREYNSVKYILVLYSQDTRRFK